MSKRNFGKEMSENYETYHILFGFFATMTDREVIDFSKKFKLCDDYQLYKEPLGSNYIKLLSDEKDYHSLVLKAHLYIEIFMNDILKKGKKFIRSNKLNANSIIEKKSCKKKQRISYLRVKVNT